MKRIRPVLLIITLASFISQTAPAQVDWVVGGKLGLSLVTGGGSTDAGLQIGPMGEAVFGKNLAVGTEFTVNTQSGTPVVWANYFKYYIDVEGSDIRPYADAGFLLSFVSGGPYFGLIFGGGAHFPVARNLYIPADIVLGPVFSDPTRFYLGFTTGIRYVIPH